MAIQSTSIGMRARSGENRDFFPFVSLRPSSPVRKSRRIQQIANFSVAVALLYYAFVGRLLEARFNSTIPLAQSVGGLFIFTIPAALLLFNQIYSVQE